MMLPKFDIPDEVIIDQASGYAVNVPLGYQGYPGWQHDYPDVIAHIYAARKELQILIVDDFLMDSPFKGRPSDALQDYVDRNGLQETERVMAERVARGKARSKGRKVPMKNGKPLSKSEKKALISKELDAIQRYIEMKRRVMHVRTVAGENRYKKPIGAVIIDDVELTYIREAPSPYDGYQKYRGSEGRVYWTMQDEGHYYVLDNDDEVLFDADNEAEVLEWMDYDSSTDYASEDRGVRDPEPGFREITPAERREFKIPLAWVDVCVAEDMDNAELLAYGYDAADRKQPRYTAYHFMRVDAVKFKRIQTLNRHTRTIDSEVSQRWKTDDNAAALMLIRKMGMRVSTPSETRGKVKAFGATTLEARHVTINQGSVRFQFVGKEGVNIDLLCKDPEVVEMIRKCKAGKSRTDKLFPEATSTRVNALLKEITGQKITAKDLRTHIACTIALREVKKIKMMPKTEREFLALRKKVAEVVSAQLGNRFQQALDSYINPTIFAPLSTDPQWLKDIIEKKYEKIRKTTGGR